HPHGLAARPRDCLRTRRVHLLAADGRGAPSRAVAGLAGAAPRGDDRRIAGSAGRQRTGSVRYSDYIDHTGHGVARGLQTILTGSLRPRFGGRKGTTACACSSIPPTSTTSDAARPWVWSMV